MVQIHSSHNEEHAFQYCSWQVDQTEPNCQGGGPGGVLSLCAAFQVQMHAHKTQTLRLCHGTWGGHSLVQHGHNRV